MEEVHRARASIAYDTTFGYTVGVAAFGRGKSVCMHACMHACAVLWPSEDRAMSVVADTSP